MPSPPLHLPLLNSSLMTEMRCLPPAAFLGRLSIPMASEVCAHISAPPTPASVPLSLHPCVLPSHHLLQETDLRKGQPEFSPVSSAAGIWPQYTGVQQRLPEWTQGLILPALRVTGGERGQWSREQESQGGEVHRIRLVILSTPVPWAKLVRGNQLSAALPSPSGTTPESFFKMYLFTFGHAGSLLLHRGFL